MPNNDLPEQTKMPRLRRTFENREVDPARLCRRACLGISVLWLMCGIFCEQAARAQSSGGSNGGQGQGPGTMHPYPQHQDVSPISPDDVDPTMTERRLRAL